jgi:hypothetical protein
MLDSKDLRSFRTILVLLIAFTIFLFLVKSRSLETPNQQFRVLTQKYQTQPPPPQPLVESTHASTIKQPVHVTYVHFINTKDLITVDNFKFFMNFAYAPCNPDIFFTIILNQIDASSNVSSKLVDILGANLVDKVQKCSIDANFNESVSLTGTNPQNTKIIVRENKPGGDLCAFVELMKTAFWINNEKLYNIFFFINSSVRGPFLPSYYLKPWYSS